MDQQPFEGPGRENRRVETWKEIAAYLQRDLRTVQRWERREHLPVHRHLHEDGVTVYAYTGELDQWWRRRDPVDRVKTDTQTPADARASDAVGRPATAVRKKLPLFAIPAIVLATTAAGVFWTSLSRSPEPVLAGGAPTVTRLFANLTREGASPTRIHVPKSSIGAVLLRGEREIYVADPESSGVLVIDTARRSIVDTIPIAGQPSWVTPSPDGRYAYVSGQTGSVVVVRTSDRTTSTIKVEGAVSGVLPTPDSRSVYLASATAGLFRLDPATGALQRLPVVGCPMYLARDDFRMYVSFQCEGSGGRPGHDAVGVFDLATGQLVGRMQGPPQVGGPLAVSPDGASLWVNGCDACKSTYYDRVGCPKVPAGIVNVFQATNFTFARSLPFPGQEPRSLAFLPGGLRVFVGAETPRVVDTLNFAVTETIAQAAPSLPMFDSSGKAAWLILDGSLVSLAPMPASCDLSGPGLVHLWPADGSADDVHNAMHGEVLDGVRFAPGIVGQALAFEGRHGEVRLGTGYDVSLESGDASLLAWVKFTSTEGEMPLVDRMEGSTSPGAGWRLFKSADHRFVFCMQSRASGACERGGAFRVASETIVQAGTWYHVALTRQMGRTSLYVNGRREVESQPGTITESPGPIELRFGRDSAGHSLHGLLDEIAEYGRGLHPAEIERIYRNATAPACIGSGVVR